MLVIDIPRILDSFRGVGSIPAGGSNFKVLLAQLEERFRDMEEAVDSSSTRNTNSDIAQCESAPVHRERCGGSIPSVATKGV